MEQISLRFPSRLSSLPLRSTPMRSRVEQVVRFHEMELRFLQSPYLRSALLLDMT